MQKLDIQICRPQQIDSKMLDCWRSFRSADPRFESPFFSFDFLLAANEVGRDVEIAVIRDSDGISGFLPFERKPNQSARPVACQMNDAHGIIGKQFSAPQILKITDDCGLKIFSFHSWFGSEQGIKDFSFSQIHCSATKLPRDSTQGFRKSLQKKSYTIKQQIRKTRKLIRDHGPIDFQYRSANPDVLETLFRWKSEQYRKQNTFDLLGLDWTKNLLRTLSKSHRASGLQGVLSVLKCNGTPVAIHFGLQEGKILHYWFPVFNQLFRQHSPGTELFLQVADFLEKETDAHTIDMGYGDQPYKSKLVSHTYHSYQGKIIPGKLSWNLAKKQYQSRQVLKSIPMKGALRKIIRSVSPNFGSWLYD